MLNYGLMDIGCGDRPDGRPAHWDKTEGPGTATGRREPTDEGSPTTGLNGQGNHRPTGREALVCVQTKT